MWSEDKIQEYIKKNLKESRYIHSLGVRDFAIKLAKKYNCDENKARIAGLIHDCAKNLNDGDIISILNEVGIKLSETEVSNPQIKHGLVGAIISKKVFKINDVEILDAVTYHTTGRKNMFLLEKIIYIADYIEPGRNYPGVDILRKQAFIDLDKALLLAFDNTIKFVLEKGELLHIDTISARNDIIIKNSLRSGGNEKRDN